MSKYERKVTKVGNSYGITFPKDVLKDAGISYGDNVQIELNDGKITLQKKKEINLPKGLSPDFFEVLERNTTKHNKTIEDLVDR